MTKCYANTIPDNNIHWAENLFVYAPKTVLLTHRRFYALWIINVQKIVSSIG